jgi:ubiquinol-cytochrome c reductase cytochrome c1 subunit
MITARRILALALLLVAPTLAVAAGGGPKLESVSIDISNQASLQRGAKYFVNYCLGCHSAQYVRYNTLGSGLGLSEDQVVKNLMFTGDRPSDTMAIAMPPGDAAVWFGRTPPDLSLVARARGTDWIYAFLKSFYANPDKPSGADNLILEGASMPPVLWDLQGIQKAVFHEETDALGYPHKIFDRFEIVSPGTLSEEEFDEVVVDLVAFLSYISEPVQLERRSLGIKVILFLVIFLLFSYALKKEIWKDVH